MDTERRTEFFCGILECLTEVEELFVYVLVPVLCLVAVGIIGIVLYQTIFDPHAIAAAATTDCLSINPDKWFPRS